MTGEDVNIRGRHFSIFFVRLLGDLAMCSVQPVFCYNSDYICGFRSSVDLGIPHSIYNWNTYHSNLNLFRRFVRKCRCSYGVGQNWQCTLNTLHLRGRNHFKILTNIFLFKIVFLGSILQSVSPLTLHISIWSKAIWKLRPIFIQFSNDSVANDFGEKFSRAVYSFLI